jgi:hypothetical protein
MAMQPWAFRVLARPMVVLFVFLAAAPTQSAAGDWYPLGPGDAWEYADGHGVHHFEITNGTRLLLGRTVAIRSYVGGVDDGLENYWLIGFDGSVLLAGFNNRQVNLALAYDPPVAMLVPPPTLGQTWSTHTMAYNLPDMSVYSIFDFTLSVLEDVQLTVPAGTYHAFGIGPPPPAAGSTATFVLSSGRSLLLDGRSALAGQPAGVTTATALNADWYAQGVGVVQYLGNTLNQLVNFSIPTPTAAVSWGKLKRLYR